MTIALTVPLTAGTYRRGFEASIDVPEPQRLKVRGRMRDERFDLEHVWVLSLPGYEVIEATAMQSHGDPGLVAPELCLRYAGIRGASIGRGFSRRIREALGEDLPGAATHLSLAIEMARVGQQVFQMPPEFDREFPIDLAGASGRALSSWQKDRAYMPGLANSCYTYRDASAAAFRERGIVCGFGPEISNPVPGSTGVFRRDKQIVIRADGAGFVCESSMRDNLHDIVVQFALDAGGTVSAASSRGERLPYAGLCEFPQGRTKGLVGLRVTRDFVEQFADRIGGAQGCTHLFDLSIDCLRLFRFGE